MEPVNRLTKEQILAMEPGRGLDRHVAETVMGWKVKHMDGIFGWMYSEQDRNRWYNIPKFSTEITDAWEVASRFWAFEIRKGPDGHWWKFRIIDEDGEAVANVSDASPAMAICKAALLWASKGSVK